MTKEPQEETYQTLENKALEEFDKDYYRLEWHTPEEIKDFLKSHLQLAYKAGEEKGRDSVPLITGIEITYPDVRQQGIAEERSRLRKWAEENHIWEEINLKELLQELQNK